MKSERKSRQLVNQLIQLRLVLYSLCFGLFAVYARCIYCLSPINIIIVAIKQLPPPPARRFSILKSAFPRLATQPSNYPLLLAKVESHIDARQVTINIVSSIYSWKAEKAEKESKNVFFLRTLATSEYKQFLLSARVLKLSM